MTAHPKHRTSTPYRTEDPGRMDVKVLRNLLTRHTDEGASAVEYGLLVAAIAAVIAGIVFALGSVVNTSFHQSCQQLTTSMSGTC